MRRDFCAPYSGRGPREWESSGDLELEGKKPKQQESGWWELEAPGTRLQAKAGCPPETSTLTLALCLEERGLLLLTSAWPLVGPCGLGGSGVGQTQVRVVTGWVPGKMLLT